mmetsp:Transcript_13536/g.24147  ORF Transcript_13536/g.24147 Transcript_13536/m.24147 type:complete len:200 (-) Transcript_13536:350-949(-)
MLCNATPARPQVTFDDGQVLWLSGSELRRQTPLGSPAPPPERGQQGQRVAAIEVGNGVARVGTLVVLHASPTRSGRVTALEPKQGRAEVTFDDGEVGWFKGSQLLRQHPGPAGKKAHGRNAPGEKSGMSNLVGQVDKKKGLLATALAMHAKRRRRHNLFGGGGGGFFMADDHDCCDEDGGFGGDFGDCGDFGGCDGGCE